MKKLRVLICSFFVLCCGLVFVACGEEKTEMKDFDVNNIIIDIQKEYIYNGENQAFDVSYEGVDVDVKYAFIDDKDSFKSLSELGTKNVGVYNVYYQISADGYNDYTSTGTIEFEIKPKDVEVIIADYMWMKSSNKVNIPGSTVVGNDISEDNLNINIQIGRKFEGETATGNVFDIAQAKYGEKYDITCEINNSNYNLIYSPAKLHVVDYVSLKDSDGNFVKEGDNVKYLSTIEEAIAEAENNYTLVLNGDISIDLTIDIDKSLTIDGSNFEIFANTQFGNGTFASPQDIASLFMIKNNVNVKFKDVILNGAQIVRAISAFNGKVIIENATITNGKKMDKWRSGGVYITHNASFEMISGTIVGNNANDSEYTKYCADLWMGANANGEIKSTISGGLVGDVFVNANSYSATNPGMFTLDGGTIKNIYVESDKGFGAKFYYKSGEIENLMISMKNNNGNCWGIYKTLTPKEDTHYEGGKLVYVNDGVSYYGKTFTADEIEELVKPQKLIEGATYVFDKCVFEAELSIYKKISLVFNDCTFNTSDSSNLYLTSVKNLVVNNCTFNGTSSDYAIDVNLYSQICEDVLIVNNIFNTICGENSAISIKQRLGSTDHPSEPWAVGSTEGKITGWVKILNNDFSDVNNTICIGEKYQENNSSANLSTGDFNVEVKNNIDGVTVFNLFKIEKNTSPDRYEDLKIKIDLQAKGYYNSTISD